MAICHIGHGKTGHGLRRFGSAVEVDTGGIASIGRYAINDCCGEAITAKHGIAQAGKLIGFR